MQDIYNNIVFERDYMKYYYDLLHEKKIKQ
jgi:hypothetical protein